MSQPVDFPESNIEFKGGAENVADLRAFKNRACVVTCWELSDAEIEILIHTRKIYVNQFFGGQLVPQYVTSDLDEMKSFVADYGAMR